MTAPGEVMSGLSRAVLGTAERGRAMTAHSEVVEEPGHDRLVPAGKARS